MQVPGQCRRQSPGYSEGFPLGPSISHPALGSPLSWAFCVFPRDLRHLWTRLASVWWVGTGVYTAGGTCHRTPWYSHGYKVQFPELREFCESQGPQTSPHSGQPGGLTPAEPRRCLGLQECPSFIPPDGLPESQGGGQAPHRLWPPCLLWAAVRGRAPERHGGSAGP